MIRFWKPSTPKEKELSDLMGKIQKESDKALVSLLPRLIEFIPEYTKLILSKLSSKFVDSLKGKTPELTDAQCAILDLLCVFMQNYDPQNPDTNPYNLLFSESHFLDNLFSHVSILDLRLIMVITNCFEFDPMRFVGWIKKNYKAVCPLIKMASETQNIESSKLVQRLTVSNMKEVYPLLAPFIKPILPTFPVSVVIDFMIASNEMKEIIPESKFEDWLLGHPRFTISDIECVTKFYNFIWLSETTIKLILRSTPPEKVKEIVWFHSRPAQSIKLSEEVLAECEKRLIDNEFINEESRDDDSRRTTYHFVHLFALSFADPNQVSEEVMKFVVSLIEDENEYIASAAIQCFIMWVNNYQYKVSPHIAFTIASIIADREKGPFINLCQAALTVFATTLPVSAAILTEDPSLRFSNSSVIQLKRSAWTFPHFVKILKSIATMKVIDYNQAYNALGYVSEFLFDGN
ncbi:hypothetical protein GPJ56_010791 [Histomonas meleagridis]|uniref:uncharacterized protein n=1 Tax=Histomonas meleagridis TaxID=135588 RepID=UPI003559CE4E|nr:hypothetical protein GPJ56_010791 [Histomonas meleagridis]KAH0801128.1 hypothetical protein GO595_006163 [Histomonas meleagridis]